MDSASSKGPVQIVSKASQSREKILDKSAEIEQKQRDSPYSNSCFVDRVPLTPLIESDPLPQGSDKEEEGFLNKEDLVEVQVTWGLGKMKEP